MNIFWLDKDIEKCAKYHCDKHVCKMIIEYAQILCTAAREEDSHIRDIPEEFYKSTHVNHPCTKWARKTQSNFIYLLMLLESLLDEYALRYNKIHKTCGVFLAILSYAKLHYGWYRDARAVKITLPPMCMPEKYKQLAQLSAYNDFDVNLHQIINAYRYYYVNEKLAFAKWKCTDVPWWVKSGEYVTY